jgi:glutamyl-tRNA synthetase
MLHGEITAEVDDVVLLRNDGVPAYNLAVTIDDGCTGIDQVVRGVDLLTMASPACLGTSHRFMRMCLWR